jgi:hypothetical protein
MQNSYCDHRNFDSVNQALLDYIRIVHDKPQSTELYYDTTRTIVENQFLVRYFDDVFKN